MKKQNNMESSSNYLFNMVQKMLTGHNHILNSINNKLIVLNILYLYADYSTHPESVNEQDLIR